MSGWRARLASLAVPYAGANSAISADRVPSARLPQPIGTNGAIGSGIGTPNAFNQPVPPVDLGELPAGPCPVCGGGLWWRVAMTEPHGPGPWRCHGCVRPAPADRLDGHAIPARGMRRPRRLGDWSVCGQI